VEKREKGNEQIMKGGRVNREKRCTNDTNIKLSAMKLAYIPTLARTTTYRALGTPIFSWDEVRTENKSPS
jgi:hypothetical protein